MSSKTQRQVLVALQGSTGVAAVVDTVLHATASIKAKVSKIHPDEDIGTFAPQRHYVAQIEPDGDLIMPSVSYDEIIVPLCMAFGEPDTEGTGGDPYTWTWDLPDTVAKAFYLWTVEYTSGGVEGDPDLVTQIVDAFGKDLEISGEAAKGWDLKMGIAGRATTHPADVGANITTDAAITPITMAETTLFIDTTWAGIGGTQCEELISFKWKLEDLHHSKQFAGSLYPNGQGSDRWKTTLELILEMSAAEAQTLVAASLTTTQYAVRIKGYNAAGNYCYIDGMYMVEEANTLDDRDGNNIIKLTLMGEKDNSDNTGTITVVNGVSAL